MENEWRPVVSGPTETAISSYTADCKRAGYLVDLRHENGTVRLYVKETPGQCVFRGQGGFWITTGGTDHASR